MRKEKIILSFIATLIGIVFALGVFFFYQSTRTLRDSQIKKITLENPTPNPTQGLFINITSPKDEEVVSTQTIKLSGKTMPNAKIVILSDSSEEAAVADKDGNFTTTVTLSKNQNILQITAVSEKGEIIKVQRTVTYTSESF